MPYLADLWVSSDSPSSFTSSSKLTISSRSGTNLEMTQSQNILVRYNRKDSLFLFVCFNHI